MMKVLLLCLAAAYAAAFAPVAPTRACAAAAARSDAVVMAAKKKGGVNPALFATGIAKKESTRPKGRKPFKAGLNDYGSGAAAGMWMGNKPWLEGKAAEAKSVSPFLALSGALGSKERPKGGAGIFFLGAHSPMRIARSSPPLVAARAPHTRSLSFALACMLACCLGFCVSVGTARLSVASGELQRDCATSR